MVEYFGDSFWSWWIECFVSIIRTLQGLMNSHVQRVLEKGVNKLQFSNSEETWTAEMEGGSESLGAKGT